MCTKIKRILSFEEIIKKGSSAVDLCYALLNGRKKSDESFTEHLDSVDIDFHLMDY